MITCMYFLMLYCIHCYFSIERHVEGSGTFLFSEQSVVLEKLFFALV